MFKQFKIDKTKVKSQKVAGSATDKPRTFTETAFAKYDNDMVYMKKATLAKKKLEATLPFLYVDHVNTYVPSHDTIRKLSTCEVKLVGGNTRMEAGQVRIDGGEVNINDGRMGPTDITPICDTCSCNADGCNGHLGYIEVPQMYHPQMIVEICSVCSLVCSGCSRILITEEVMTEMRDELMLMVVPMRLEKLAKMIKPNCSYQGSEYGDKACKYTGANSKSYKGMAPIGLDSSSKYVDIHSSKSDGSTTSHTVTEIARILENVSDEDAELLGFDVSIGSHPRNMVMRCIQVLPNRIRIAPKFMMALRNHYSVKYEQIARDAAEYFESAHQLKQRKISIDMIASLENGMKRNHINITNRFNDITFAVPPQGENTSKRSLASLLMGRERKKGYIRKNFVARRVNKSARTVVGADPFLPFNTVGIPDRIMRSTTLRERVNNHNLQTCIAALKQGLVKSIINYTDDEGKFFHSYTVTEEKRSSINLKPGQIIVRYLRDGDMVYINRQPSLWRHSLLGGRIMRTKGDSVKIGLPWTTPTNADFDGDEINVHMPEHISARAEISELLNVEKSMISQTDGSATMGLVHDSLTGFYVMSLSSNILTRLQFYQYVEGATDGLVSLKQIQDFEMSAFVSDISIHPTSEELRAHSLGKDHKTKLIVTMNEEVRETLLRDFVMTDLDTRMEQLSDEFVSSYLEMRNVKFRERDHERNRTTMKRMLEGMSVEEVVNVISTNFERGDEYDESVLKSYYKGCHLLSTILPRDFQYENDGLKITRGVVEKGKVKKSHLGTSPSGIVKKMAIRYSTDKVSQFMTNANNLAREFMENYGYTLGIEDCRPSDSCKKELRNEMSANIARVTVNVNSGAARNINSAALQSQIDFTGNLLDKAITGMDENNPLMVSIDAGIKFNKSMALRMKGTIGLQTLENRILPKRINDGRRLNPYTPISRDGEIVDVITGNGMATSGYAEGISVRDFIAHATSARESSIVNKAGVPIAGSMKQDLDAHLSNIKAEYGGGITDSENRYISIHYFGDGLDPGRSVKTSMTKGVNIFANVREMIGDVNIMIEDYIKSIEYVQNFDNFVADIIAKKDNIEVQLNEGVYANNGETSLASLIVVDMADEYGYITTMKGRQISLVKRNSLSRNMNRRMTDNHRSSFFRTIVRMSKFKV